MKNKIETFIRGRSGFAKNLGLLSSSNLIARVFSGLSQAIIGRAVGVSLYGTFASSLALARLLSIFFSFGLDLWLLRTSSAEEKQNIPRINGLVLTWKLASGPIWIGLLTLLATFLNQESYTTQVVFLCAVLVWLEEILRSTLFINEVNSGIKQAAILTISTQAAIMIIVGLFNFYWGYTAVSLYLYAFIIVHLFGCSVAIYFVKRQFGLDFKLNGIWAALKEAAQYAASTALAMTYGKIDITFVNNWLGNTASGQYGPALGIAQAFSIIPNSANGILFKRFGAAFSGSTGYLRQEYRKVLLMMSGGGFALALLIAPFSALIIRLLYGPDFAQSGRILLILVFIIPLRFIAVTSGVLLTTVNWHTKRIYVQIVTVVLNVVLNLWVIFMTSYGIFGIAFVYLFTEICLSIGYTLMAQTYFFTAVTQSK
ncbi:MAG: oligosaccharide flippase family protein [Anaerolineae bacterium]